MVHYGIKSWGGLGQRARKSKKLKVNYDETEPPICQNCKFFIPRLYSKETGENFPPRCDNHKFAVQPWAICDTHIFEDK